jgi:hypothetical protein
MRLAQAAWVQISKGRRFRKALPFLKGTSAWTAASAELNRQHPCGSAKPHAVYLAAFARVCQPENSHFHRFFADFFGFFGFMPDFARFCPVFLGCAD